MMIWMEPSCLMLALLVIPSVVWISVLRRRGRGTVSLWTRSISAIAFNPAVSQDPVDAAATRTTSPSHRLHFLRPSVPPSQQATSVMPNVPQNHQTHLLTNPQKSRHFPSLFPMFPNDGTRQPLHPQLVRTSQSAGTDNVRSFSSLTHSII
jgi:hypothetical protein